MVTILSFWNIFSALDPLGPLPWGPKLSCPTELVTTNKCWFSPSVLGGKVVHLVMSSSAVDRVVEVVTLAKSCPSTGGLNMWLNKVVWGHLLLDPRWIAPNPWTTSQWLKVTCYCMASLSFTMLPTKGWRSGLLGGLNFSTQYYRLLAKAIIRRVSCWCMSWYDSSSGMKVFLLRHLGAGGMVYCWTREALMLTLGI